MYLHVFTQDSIGNLAVLLDPRMYYIFDQKTIWTQVSPERMFRIFNISFIFKWEVIESHYTKIN